MTPEDGSGAHTRDAGATAHGSDADLREADTQASATVIRAPNHLGDLVMALPALALARGADVIIAAAIAPLLDLVEGPGRRIPIQRGVRGFRRALAQVRRGGYRRGVLLTPSFSSALLFAAAGVETRRGSATDRRRALLTDAVARAQLDALHRSAGFVYLVSGQRPSAPPVPRLDPGAAARARWADLWAASGRRGPIVGIFPGGDAASRRWDAERFAELARRLAADGAGVPVFGGPGERALSATVAGEWGVDLGGRTDLPLLAAGLEACDLLVSNDSGPAHLAAAVGTRTVSLWGAGDPASTGPGGSGHVLLRRTDLPCVPCLKNACPRRGPGTLLADAERECLRLITVTDVEATVHTALAGTGAAEGAR